MQHLERHPSLSHCPECRYNLTGLPCPHACPECGLPYDHDSRVWRPPGCRIIWGAIIGYAIFWLNFLHATVVAPGSVRWPGQWIILTAFSGFFVYLAWRSWLLYKRGRFVAVCPDGIRYRLQPESEFIPWCDLLHVTPQRYDRLCRLRRFGRPDVVLIGMFSDAEDVLAFVNMVESRRAAAANAD